MDLRIEGLKNYRVEKNRIRRRRDEIILVELDDQGKGTGYLWREPFDPLKGNKKELESRFENRVTSKNTPPVFSSERYELEEMIRLIIKDELRRRSLLQRFKRLILRRK